MIELDFKNFLSEEEAVLDRPKSSADLPISQRLQAGWGAEDFVIAVLNRMIGTVQKSNSQDDMGRAKLDAFITSKFTHETVEAQIKTRESGDDILVEWYKAYPNLEGRDKIGRAKLYVTMDPSREKIYLISADAVKAECERLFMAWKAGGERPVYRDTAGEVRLQQSRDRMGEYKVMMYLRPGPLRNKGLPGWPTTVTVPQDMRTTHRQPDPAKTMVSRSLPFPAVGVPPGVPAGKPSASPGDPTKVA